MGVEVKKMGEHYALPGEIIACGPFKISGMTNIIA
jgi:hypothetical protein